MEEKPNYYAVIPANVRYDEDLKANAKLLYGEITALTYKTGICYASNNYFARLYQVDASAISKWVKNLQDKNYISVNYVKENNQIIRREIRIVGIDKYQYVLTKDNGGYCQKNKENNTSINNTSIKENVKRKDYFEDEELNNLFNEFLEQRKKQKAVNSDRAIKLLINKLEPYEDDIKKQMIEQSILNSWKGVFEIKKKKESRFEREQRILKEMLSDEKE